MAAETAPKGGHANFVHLRVRSIYSLLEGAVGPKELAKLAREMRMPAVAVTDTNNLFGVYEIADNLAKSGVQPIVGVTLSVDLSEAPAPYQNTSRQSYPAVALLVKDPAGYIQLSKLLSSAYLDVEPGEVPHVGADRLAQHAEGLILLTGGPNGPVNRLLADGQPQAAEALLDRLANWFGNRLYVELQRHGLANEGAVEEKLIDLAYAKGLPLVATNDVHFGREDMHEAHDALFCIADGTFLDVEDRRRLTPEHRFKSAEEMMALFSDLPEAIENTLEIARRCAFRPKKRTPILPQFVPESGLSPCRTKCARKPKPGSSGGSPSTASLPTRRSTWDRLEFEIGVITKMGFPGLLPDRLRLHEVDAAQRHSGRRARLGSHVAGRVGARHYQSRSDPVRDWCSSASSIPSASRCRTSTSTFCQERRDEVVRYVQRNMAATRLATSSRSARLQARAAGARRRAALCNCRSAWWTAWRSSFQPAGQAVSLMDAGGRANRV
jgi:DNA polymerase-3 subunit alpha